MTYTANPLDPTKPTSSDKARYAADELRAIKTKLVEHETAVVTTLPDSIDALSTAFSDYVAENVGTLHQQQLTGSGNFTVPAGVTKLYVTMRAGGKPGWKAGTTLPGLPLLMWQEAVEQPTLQKVLTVSPGDVIAYSVGSDQTINIYGDGSGPAVIAAQVTAAGDTTFGALTAKPASTPPARDKDDEVLASLAPSIYNHKVRDLTLMRFDYPYPKYFYALNYANLTSVTAQPAQSGLLLVGW